jgi:hypothetical protein
MTRFKSILCASLLTLAVCSSALGKAGEITGKPGEITGKPGEITGITGEITGRTGEITGLPLQLALSLISAIL